MRYLFLLFLFPFAITAQTFEKLLTDEELYNPNDIIELSGNYFISCIIRSSANDNYNLKLLKFDKNGVKLDQIIFTQPTIGSQGNLLALSDSTFIVVNIYKTENGFVDLIYRKMDLDFNVIDSTTLNLDPLVSSSAVVYSKIDKLNSGIIIHAIGFMVISDMTQKGVHFIRMDTEFENLSTSFYNRLLDPFVKSIVQYPNKDSMMVFFAPKVYIVDKDAHIVDSMPEDFYTFNYPETITRLPTESTAWYNNKLYASGMYYKLGSYHQDLSKDTLVSYENGEDYRTAFHEPMSINNSGIFISGIIGYRPAVYNGVSLGLESYIRLYQIDLDMNPTWIKDYNRNDGYYYIVFNTLATSDGGCIIAATRNNYDTQGEKVDLYLLKVDSLGNYTPMVDIQEPETSNFMVYPNPGSSYFTIENQDINSNCELLLYSNIGQIMVRKILQNSSENIETSAFPTGIYFYEVRSNSGIIGRGKWIKQ
ncbi:MAG: T9SS type A sorting domain-containing protein [Salinivirgaceae bacterium]|nr:T9SS type A sorting domain-containing protein [Salinivirgaceae bacterium]MDD4748095.1 T9SS type A sorting domain-containing protein [Salinivirgaceae bacterium]